MRSPSPFALRHVEGSRIPKLAILAVLVVSLSSVDALAQAKVIAGRGRVSLAPAIAYVPDDPFTTNTQNALNTTRTDAPKLAYGGWASFGYGATDNIEAAVDLMASYQTISFDGREPFYRFTYGGGIGARFLWRLDLGALELQPRIPIGLMGSVVSVQGGGPDVSATESFITTYFIGAGADLIVGDAYGLGIEYRLHLGRGRAPEPVGGSINAGGHFLMVNFSYYLLGEAPHQSERF